MAVSTLRVSTLRAHTLSQARSGADDSSGDGKGGITVDKVEARKTYVEVLVRWLLVMAMGCPWLRLLFRIEPKHMHSVASHT